MCVQACGKGRREGGRGRSEPKKRKKSVVVAETLHHNRAGVKIISIRVIAQELPTVSRRRGDKKGTTVGAKQQGGQSSRSPNAVSYEHVKMLLKHNWN